MAEPLGAPPALSTSSQHIFQDDRFPDPNTIAPPVPEDRFTASYEISSTINEIRKHKYKKVALQFPDRLLSDAPRVAAALRAGLGRSHRREANRESGASFDIQELNVNDEQEEEQGQNQEEVRPYILGDTSYGACCVDEIAAEHVNADVVVHYGRACLSPTARLPVIYVFVEQELDLEAAAKSFEELYPDKQQKVILMADVAYARHLPNLSKLLETRGYIGLYRTEVEHNPSSLIPNRTVPSDVITDTVNLATWSLFHLSSPPSSLLLLLASRVSGFNIYEPNPPSSASAVEPSTRSTSVMMRRRYALLLRASTAPIIGILLNTLSHKSLLPTLASIQKQIRAAGKKSYTFVVGKINPAKLANFAEIEAWVIVGCWESELVEGDGFWKPMITPWELSIALQHESERVWGQWESGWRRGPAEDAQDDTTDHESFEMMGAPLSAKEQDHLEGQSIEGAPDGDYDSEPESAPPDFDLRTGRYVSQSRPLQLHSPISIGIADQKSASTSLIKKNHKTELTSIGGEASPGAQFLKDKRTWRGLGSESMIAYDNREEAEGASLEEGRRGVARGYTNPHTAVKT